MNILMLGSFDDVKKQIAAQFSEHRVKCVNYGLGEDKKSYSQFDLVIYIEVDGKYHINLNNPKVLEEPHLSEVLQITRALNRELEKKTIK